MGAPWTVRLYGTDTYQAGTSVAKTTIEGLADVQYWEFKAGWIKPIPEFEDSPREYLDGTKDSAWRLRISYTPEMTRKYFPTTATGIETFFKTTVLNKQYKWFWFNDYPLRPLDGASPIANTKLHAVIISGISVDDSLPGMKKITLNMQNRSLS